MVFHWCRQSNPASYSAAILHGCFSGMSLMPVNFSSGSQIQDCCHKIDSTLSSCVQNLFRNEIIVAFFFVTDMQLYKSNTYVQVSCLDFFFFRFLLFTTNLLFKHIFSLVIWNSWNLLLLSFALNYCKTNFVKQKFKPCKAWIVPCVLFPWWWCAFCNFC